MIESMVKVEIVGEKERIDEVISILHDLGVAHLEESLELESDLLSSTLLSDEEDTERLKLKEALELVLEVEDALGIKREELELSSIENPDELLKKARELREELVKIQSEEKNLLDQERSLSDYRSILGALLPLLESKEFKEERAFVGVTLPKGESRIVSLIKDELEKISPGEIELLTSDMRGDRMAVLMVMPIGVEEKVRELVWNEGLSELRLPEEYQKLSLKEALKAIEEELSLLPKKLMEIRERRLRFRERIASPLILLKNRISEKLEKIVAKEKYTNSSHFGFLLRAWLPKAKVKSLSLALSSRLDDSFYMEVYPPERKEFKKVPVNLKNPRLLQPFQLILNIFQPPIYGTIDPTPFLYAFFPFYFGFMLGDMGYGLVGLLLFAFIYRASRAPSPMRKIATLGLWAMGWTMIFGLLYGEAFGDLSERMGIRPLLIHRTHDVMPILIAAIIFGVFQVLLGILLGVYNNFRVGHNRHGFFEILRFLGLLGLILGLFGVLHKIPGFFTIFGAGLFVFSAILALSLEGIAAPLEILSAAGNMFSFARLMAIGMSSAILGMIANLLGGMMGILLLGFIVALFFHILNFILGMFDPTVQGLRLQFVEFFSKFFMPGGRAYRPFRKGGSHYVA